MASCSGEFDNLSPYFSYLSLPSLSHSVGLRHTFPFSSVVAFRICTAVVSHNRIFPMAISNNLSLRPIRIFVAAHLANLVAARAPSDTPKNAESLPEKLFRPLLFVQFAHFCAHAFIILHPITHVRAPARNCHRVTICYRTRGAARGGAARGRRAQYLRCVSPI